MKKFFFPLMSLGIIVFVFYIHYINGSIKDVQTKKTTNTCINKKIIGKDRLVTKAGRFQIFKDQECGRCQNTEFIQTLQR